MRGCCSKTAYLRRWLYVLKDAPETFTWLRPHSTYRRHAPYCHASANVRSDLPFSNDKKKGRAHTKKAEWLKVSSCCVTPSSRKILPRTRTAQPSANPVIDADMPSPTYFELHACGKLNLQHIINQLCSKEGCISLKLWTRSSITKIEQRSPYQGSHDTA